jgi:hypothetical protein
MLAKKERGNSGGDVSLLSFQKTTWTRIGYNLRLPTYVSEYLINGPLVWNKM